MSYELKYRKLLELIADGATRIDYNKDGNYTVTTTRLILDGNQCAQFVNGAPKKVLYQSLDEKLEKWVATLPKSPTEPPAT